MSPTAWHIVDGAAPEFASERRWYFNPGPGPDEARCVGTLTHTNVFVLFSRAHNFG